MVQVNTFDGGLATRVDPSLIKINQAQDLYNVDPNPLVLTSAKDYTETTEVVGTTFYRFEDSWIEGYNRDYVEYEDKLYWSDGVKPTKKIPGATINEDRQLGLDKPEGTLTLVAATSDIRLYIRHIDLNPINSGDKLVGSYVYTIYDVTYDIESPPSDIYNIYTNNLSTPLSSAANLQLTVSDTTPYISTDTSDPLVGASHFKLYRVGDTLISYTEVGSKFITGSTAIDFGIDTLFSSSFILSNINVLDSQRNYPPESNMLYLIEVYSIFFGAVDSEIRYSMGDNPNYWPLENSIKLGKTVTGLLPTPQGLLAFTRDETFIITGTDSASFTKILISKRQGCLNHRTCQVVKNSPVWVSHEGICIYQNGYVQAISKSLLGNIALNPVASTVHDEQYYLLQTSGDLLVLDMRFGLRFYKLTFSTGLGGLGTFEGSLYFSTLLTFRLCTAFTGSNLQLIYISPVFIEGNHAGQKAYNNIYIRYNGTFDVTVYIDGESVITKTITGNTITELKPPANKQRGYSIHFVISGTGTIYTIDTKSMGRVNGR